MPLEEAEESRSIPATVAWAWMLCLLGVLLQLGLGMFVSRGLCLGIGTLVVGMVLFVPSRAAWAVVVIYVVLVECGLLGMMFLILFTPTGPIPNMASWRLIGLLASALLPALCYGGMLWCLWRPQTRAYYD